MPTFDADALLTLWESGIHATPARRGLLLMAAACPDATLAALLQASIGRRDAWLLQLREEWFGSRVECVVTCPACGTSIEIDFRIDGIRSASAESDHACEVTVDGTTLSLRLPTSADLLAIESCADTGNAVQRLLQRCLQAPALEACSPALLGAASAAMGMADPQGDVTLDVVCPSCAARSEPPFDIVGHLWSEFDHWAQGMLRCVHTLAARHGWSEQSILRMSAPRRQAYLQLAGAA